MTCVGKMAVQRRWWQSRCHCPSPGYAIDAVLGLESFCTRRLRQQVTRLSADVSFAKTQEHLEALLGVPLSKEVIRQHCHREGRELIPWRTHEPNVSEEFAAAAGQMEFTVDAGKVNTLEEGWRDVKIGCFQKRPRGATATPAQWQSRHLPAPTARMAWATIAPIRRFRRSWRRWSRRLGVNSAADLHVLGDGASWIWRAAERSLTGSQQTLDIYHACGQIAKAGERLYGQGSEKAHAFLDRGRQFLLESGWAGVCQLLAAERAALDQPPRRLSARRQEALRLTLQKLENYFAKNQQRLDYRARLLAGDAIGSGAVEGWAKTLGLRLKARGARWREKNVPGMCAIICARHSNQWSAYWSQPKPTPWSEAA